MPTIDEEAYEIAGDWIQDNTSYELDSRVHVSLAKLLADYAEKYYNMRS